MSPPLILSLGYDRSLMASRTMLLRQAGYLVKEGRDFTEALAAIQEQSPDIVLICHTVPRDQRKRLIKDVQNKKSGLPILCIEINAYQNDTHGCDSTGNDPEDLLEQLRRALTKQKIKLTTPPSQSSCMP